MIRFHNPLVNTVRWPVSLALFLASLCLAVGPSRIAFGQSDFLPVAQLAAIFPPGAQAGTTIDVVLAGEHLDGPCQLTFGGAAWDCHAKLDAKGQPVANTFVVQVPADAQPGAYDVRLQGRFGLSNPRQFMVGSLPEVAHPKPSTDASQPTALPFESTLNARTIAGNRAWFQVAVPDVPVIYVALDAPDSRAEPIVTIYGPNDRVMLRGRLPKRRFEFPSHLSGDYRIEVHDLLYRGGDDFGFRLTMSTTPLANLGSDAMATATLDRDELTRINDAAYKQSQPNSHQPTWLNSADKDSASDTGPWEVTGLFPTAGQPARFLLKAKAKEVYWIEVFSHRLGHATDATLVLERIDLERVILERIDNEKVTHSQSIDPLVLEGSEQEHTTSATGFDLDSRDDRLRFTVPADGTYRISLRDAFNTSAGSPQLPYRLVVRRPQPDFDLIAVPDQGPRSRPLPGSVHPLPPTLRRGGTTSVRVFGERRDDFDTDIELSAEGLPPGVTCLGAVLGPGDECASLTFYAADDAPVWAGPIRIIGQARGNGLELRRVAQSGSPIWSVKDTRQDRFQARRTDTMTLAVIEEAAPILLEPVTPIIEARAGEKISVKMKVTRRNGYDQIVSVRPFVLGESDKSARSDHSIPKDATEVTWDLDLAQLGVKPGEHSFVFHGNADKNKYIKPTSDSQPTNNTKPDNKPAKPRDLTFPLFSKPIRLKVRAADSAR